MLLVEGQIHQALIDDRKECMHSTSAFVCEMSVASAFDHTLRPDSRLRSTDSSFPKVKVSLCDSECSAIGPDTRVHV